MSKFSSPFLMKSPLNGIGDAISVASNFLKGAGGVAASMLSTTSAQAGQSVKSQADFNKQYPANEGVENDGGELPNKKTKNKSSVAKMTSPLKVDTCWDGYTAEGKKDSPSGRKTAGGNIVKVNNCVKSQ